SRSRRACWRRRKSRRARSRRSSARRTVSNSRLLLGATPMPTAGANHGDGATASWQARREAKVAAIIESSATLWIPAADRNALDAAIVGNIQVIAEFKG